MSRVIKVAIVEDNSLLLNSLNYLFNTDEVKCVLAVDNLRNIVSDIKRTGPDVVLMDIGLPDISGIEGVRTVKLNFPQVQVLMFTVFEDDENIFDAIKCGASGYILKNTPVKQIVEAVKDLHSGGVPMSPAIARKVIQSFQNKAPSVHALVTLSAREKEILFSLVDGHTYQKIADKYYISLATVRTHISNIYEKLHVNNKAQAISKVLGKN